MDKVIRISLALRMLMLVAAIGALVGSLVVYGAGARYLGQAVGLLQPDHGSEKVLAVVLVLEAMDSFLFGIVLTLFAYGIAFGFVFQVPEHLQASLPEWIRFSGIGQLKQTLAEVVLVILIVSFAKQVVETDEALQFTDLVLPLSILSIAAALALLKVGSGGRPH